MGYVAKSDGKVTRDEIELAEQVMQQMHLTSEQRVLAINLFNEGKKKAFRSTTCWRSLNARLSDAGILFKCFWKFSFRRLWPMAAVCTDEEENASTHFGPIKLAARGVLPPAAHGLRSSAIR